MLLLANHACQKNISGARSNAKKKGNREGSEKRQKGMRYGEGRKFTEIKA